MRFIAHFLAILYVYVSQGVAQNLDEARTYIYKFCTLDFEAGCVLHEKILAFTQEDTLS